MGAGIETGVPCVIAGSPGNARIPDDESSIVVRRTVR